MGGLAKIMGVVQKKITRQLVNKDMSGYVHNYYGTVTGKVIKADIYGSEYFFLISKIVHQVVVGERKKFQRH